MKFPGVLLN